MTRLLFWIAFIVLVVMVVRSKLRAALKSHVQPPGAGPVRAPAAQVVPAPERMACCAACGTHFPSSEAVAAAGRDYCSQHCRAAHAPQA